MKNVELARIFNEIYYMLSTDDKARFEALAYQRAARSIDDLITLSFCMRTTSAISFSLEYENAVSFPFMANDGENTG